MPIACPPVVPPPTPPVFDVDPTEPPPPATITRLYKELPLIRMSVAPPPYILSPGNNPPPLYPLLVVPSYKLIVVEKNKFYNLIKTDGSEIINGYVLDSAYMRTNTETGENKFYMTFNGNTLDIEEKMLELGEE